MDFSCFTLGDRIEMQQYSSAYGKKISEKKYGSKLLDYDGDRIIKVSMPITEGRIIPLNIQDVYAMCFFTNSGLYQCLARVDKRYTDNKVHVLEMFLLTGLKKFQRRRFYRLECMFPVKYRILSDVEERLIRHLEKNDFETEEDRANCLAELEKIKKEWDEGDASDISGGGIRFHAGKEMEKDVKMEIVLPLSFSHGVVPLSFVMRVISCSRTGEGRYNYEVRGEFENVKDTDRETVIRYVFDEQRRRLRKE